MDDLWPLISMLAGLSVFIGGTAAVMVRARRRGITGVLTIADELYQPTAHQAQVEIRAQVERGDEDPGDVGR